MIIKNCTFSNYKDFCTLSIINYTILRTGAVLIKNNKVARSGFMFEFLQCLQALTVSDTVKIDK